MDGDNRQTEAEQNGEGWAYKPESTSPAQEQPFTGIDAGGPLNAPVQDSHTIEWTASEFIAHEKSFGWYAVLFFIGALLAGAMYAITRDRFSTGAVIAFVVIVAIVAARKPRIVKYRLDGSGVSLGAIRHSYGEYKSFALVDEGPFVSVVFIPMKRFEFPLSIYLAPESSQKALDVLSAHLPLEQGKLDAVDQFMRQLRF